MADRRRNIGPAGASKPPLYDFMVDPSIAVPPRPQRKRSSQTIRNIYLKTGLVPPASGSAYLELESHPPSASHSLIFNAPTLKLTATVHGPRPLPRSAPFTPHLALTCTIKYAPYAHPCSGEDTQQVQQQQQQQQQRDLAVMLEMALRAIIVGERFPKTGVDVVVTVLEAEGDVCWWSQATGEDNKAGRAGWGALNVLSGAVTVASMALVDAGIDVLDSVVGGVAAYVDGRDDIVLDPSPVEHSSIRAACTVGYILSRDELPLMWLKGLANGNEMELLIDAAVKAAVAAKRVVDERLRDAVKSKLGRPNKTVL